MIKDGRHNAWPKMAGAMVEAPLAIFYFSKRQVYYSKQVVNEFCRVAGVLRFTMVNFALVSFAGNGGIMKG